MQRPGAGNDGFDYWANVVTLIGVSVIAALLMAPLSSQRQDVSSVEKVN